MRRFLLTLALGALAGPAAAADEAAQTADLRCMLVVAITGAQAGANEQAKQGLAAGLGYYMGRLKGRDPGIDLAARITTTAKGLGALTDLQPDFTRCGAEMKTFGVETQAVGRAMQALDQTPPKPTP